MALFNRATPHTGLSAVTQQKTTYSEARENIYWIRSWGKKNIDKTTLLANFARQDDKLKKSGKTSTCVELPVAQIGGQILERVLGGVLGSQAQVAAGGGHAGHRGRGGRRHERAWRQRKRRCHKLVAVPLRLLLGHL